MTQREAKKDVCRRIVADLEHARHNGSDSWAVGENVDEDMDRIEKAIDELQEEMDRRGRE